MATVSTTLTNIGYQLGESKPVTYGYAELLVYLNKALTNLTSELVALESDWVLKKAAALLVTGKNSITMPTRCISVRKLWITDIAMQRTDISFDTSGDPDVIASVAGNFDTEGFNDADKIFVYGSTSNDGEYAITTVATNGLSVNIASGALPLTEVAGDTVTILKSEDNEVYETDVNDLYDRRKDLSSNGEPAFYAQDGTLISFDYIADEDYGIELLYSGKESALTASSSMPYNDEFNDVLENAAVLMAKNRTNRIKNMDNALFSMFRSAAMANNISRSWSPRRTWLGF
jgi:hypothetical protein